MEAIARELEKANKQLEEAKQASVNLVKDAYQTSLREADKKLREEFARAEEQLKSLRRGTVQIYAAVGLFVGLAILALVVGLMFGLTDQIANELNTNNNTYVSQAFLDRMNQAENFAGLAIFIGAVVGIILIVSVLWYAVRNMF